MNAKSHLRTLSIILLTLGLLTLTRSVWAQGTTAWTGYYFANRNLQGYAALVRDDATIDFAWGTGSPGAGIPADDFSVRWVRWLYIDTPGNWTLTTITDDGVRLFVDDKMVIDAWNDQTLTARSATVNLGPAFHLVRLEYFDGKGNAEAHLQIISPDYPDWRGEYFANPDLTGTPVFTRNDSALNFNFGGAGPGGNIPGTNFSARWTRTQSFNAGRYRFTTTTDDGVRLWIDGQLLIDQWHDQTSKSWTMDTNLGDGNHWLRMDYYQHGSNAQAALTWVPVTGSVDLWRGEYFDNSSVSGNPAFSRDDADINFDWGTESPGRGISKNTAWSARWSKRANYTAGFYTVTATSDDGMRMWLDNTLIIDQWHDQPPTPYSAMVYLTTGTHDWRVEFYQHTGGASMRVQIAPGAIASDAQPTGVPLSEILVDSKNAGFVKNNPSSAWQTSAQGSNRLAYFIKNNAYAQTDNNWVRWYPALPNAGTFELFAYLPANIGTTRRALYWVAHAGMFDSRELNQSLYSNQWVSLGKYYFSATDDEYVSLSDVTYEQNESTVVVADAVKFVAR